MMISLVFLQFSSVLFARNKEVAAMFYVSKVSNEVSEEQRRRKTHT